MIILLLFCDELQISYNWRLFYYCAPKIMKNIQLLSIEELKFVNKDQAMALVWLVQF